MSRCRYRYEDLPEHLRADGSDTARHDDVTTVPHDGLDIEARLADIERRILMNALKRTNGVRKDAADLLRISFRSLRYKLAKYGIGDPED